VHISKIERVQRKFGRYAMRGLGWMDMYDLFLYVDLYALICLETLTRRRSDACVMFVFDVFSGRVGSPNLLSLVSVIAPRYRTRVAISCGLIFTALTTAFTNP
jgi:hypothetical protein